MLVEVKSSGERVSISIDGRELGRGVRYPEAIALLDGAYTNEIGALLDELRQYRLAAELALEQAARALVRMGELIKAAEERHLEGGHG